MKVRELEEKMRKISEAVSGIGRSKNMKMRELEEKMRKISEAVSGIGRSKNMKIEDCQTLPEFFGVEGGDIVWIEGEPFLVYKGLICGENVSSQTDSKALVGCLTGQLEWSKEPPKPEITEDEEFGNCKRCGYEFNSELISEYEIKYCPKCGQKIEEIMTEEEKNLIREIAAWFPDWNLLYLNKTGSITHGYHNGCWVVPFGVADNGSKAYAVLAPILEKYGEIDLDDYRG